MTILEAQNDWRVLDTVDFKVPNGVRLLSHESYDKIYTDGILPVEEIKQGWLSRFFSFWSTFSLMTWALQVLLVADKRTVIIANGSSPLGVYICLLNYCLFFRSRTILFWDSHFEPKNAFKKYFARLCFLGCNAVTLWSKKQTNTYSKFFNLPEDLFVFIPYKSTHSKVAPRQLPTIEYVFSGGNSNRDYKALVDAVRGTDVTVIISASRVSVLKTIGDQPNVITLAATEPSYSKLMAASRFVVIPIMSTGIRGWGESNICNAMWHGKAIVSMDDVSAEDYVVDGKNGYVVEPGDVESLRKRILELWYDREKSEKMGASGQQFAKQYFTQVLGIRRLVRLACLVGKEKF